MSFWHRFIHPVTAHFRRGRGAFLQSQFPQISTWKICDLGGSRHFWEKVDIGVPPANITIYNISENEAQAISADVKEEPRIVIYDGKKIPAADLEFDLLICNSVLEHVNPEDRPRLAAEMVRVAKRIFVQTPAYSFPIEPHFVMPFIHWLPRQLGYYLAHVSPWRLLSKPTHETICQYWWGTQLLKEEELKGLFPDGAVEYERIIGIVKSYYVVLSKSGA